MDLYAQNILDRYKTPYHKGDLKDADITHEEANHSCGDKVTIHLKLDDSRVEDYHFEGAGCAISMASADMAGDLITGMTLDEILALSKEDIIEMLGIEISVRRSKCALLSLLAIQNGILENRGEEKKEWMEFHI